MRFLETPPDFKDVIRRRLQLAPPSVLEKAFGDRKVNVYYWAENDLVFIAIGSNKYLNDSRDRNFKYSSPFPGVSLENNSFGRPAISIESRQIFVGKLTIQADSLVVGLKLNASCVLFDMELNSSRFGRYDIDWLYASTLGDRLGSGVAYDFEQSLTRFLSPNIQRD